VNSPLVNTEKAQVLLKLTAMATNLLVPPLPFSYFFKGGHRFCKKRPDRYFPSRIMLTPHYPTLKGLNFTQIDSIGD
jgi:hypothetical protein